MQVYKIDINGIYLEPVILENSKEVPIDCIEIPPPQGLYRPKWTGTNWTEGMTQEEINAINNQPKEPSIEDRLALAEDTINFLLGL